MTSPLEPGASAPHVSSSLPPSPAPAPRRFPWLPWAVAAVADGLQWVLLPLFAPGFASPFADVLEVVTAAVLVKLCGWHWAFLPSLAAELVPGVDLVPTWLAAVWIATRGSKGNAKRD